jgi:heme/copper-type cytochrome/quinol oxidase subunit 3
VEPARDRVRTFPIGWWGMILLITTEAMVFTGFLAAYFYLQAVNRDWPLGGIEPPELPRTVLFSVVLIGSSIPVVIAERAGRRGRIDRVRAALAVAFVLGAAFLVNQLLEYRALGFGLRDNAYTALFYEITGLHGLHVAIGLAMSGVVQAKAWTGRITVDRHLTLRVFGMYWHFVDAVWVFVFASLYVSPHLRSG